MIENREHNCLLEQIGNGTRHISQQQYYTTSHCNSNNLSLSHTTSSRQTHIRNEYSLTWYFIHANWSYSGRRVAALTMIVMHRKEMTGTTFNAMIFFSKSVQAGASCCCWWDVDEGDDSKSSSSQPAPSSRTMTGLSSWLVVSSFAEDILFNAWWKDIIRSSRCGGWESYPLL